MIRQHKSLIPVLSVLLLAFAGSAFAAEETSVETFPLAKDGRVSLENVNGNVKVEGWDGAEVKVEYTKRADNARDLERIKVDIDAQADHIHIETDYEETERGWFRGNSNEVEYRLWVPRGARLDEVELVNGDLELRGLDGKVEVSLVNGEVEAWELGGDVEIETVNGEQKVHAGRAGAGQRISLSSVNGSIELYLPAGADASIEAETVHGPIKNDFGLEVEKDRFVGRSLQGKVGGGGAQIELENVNGSIEIREE